MPVQAMTGKEKRMMEAARLRYMEGCSNKEIAKRLGISHNTVRKYFSQEDMDQFKRFYSDMELFEFQQRMEQDVRDGVQLSNNLLARAIQHKDADDSTYLRASDQALKIRKRKIKLLQELGIIEKPKERKEVTENNTESSLAELREINEQVKELEADQ